jgi:hypothetical protein
MSVEHRSLCWVGDQREQPRVAPPLVRDQLNQQLTITAGIQAQPSRSRVRLDMTAAPTPKLLIINDDQKGELVVPVISLMSTEGARELGLAPGSLAVAVVKSATAPRPSPSPGLPSSRKPPGAVR